MVLGCLVTAITSSSSKADDTSSTQLPTTCVALLTSIKFMSRSFSWNPFTGNQAKSSPISKHPSTGSINQQRNKKPHSSRIKAKVLPIHNQIYERKGTHTIDRLPRETIGIQSNGDLADAIQEERRDRGRG